MLKRYVNQVGKIAKQFVGALRLNFSFKGKSPQGELRKGDVWYVDYHCEEAKSYWRQFNLVVKVYGIVPESMVFAEVFLADSEDYPAFLDSCSPYTILSKRSARKLLSLQN